MPNEDLTTRLAAQAHGVEVRPRGTTIADLLERQKPEIAKALPRHLTTDRFSRIALNELRRNERLQACRPASLLGALMQAAALGLEPGPLGQVYLVPFKDEVTLIVGYRGYIDLFRRSGEGSTIVAREVCQGDRFSLHYTAEADKLVHEPELMGDRGPAYAYYGIARFRDGSQLVHVMTVDEINKHRNRSRSKSDGPWVTDYDAMARKTVIRAMSPYLPLSAEVALALESDEGIYTWDGGAEPRAVPSIPAAVSAPADAPAPPTAAGSVESGAAPPPLTDAAAGGEPLIPVPTPPAAAYDPLAGWEDEEMATLAHTEIRDRIAGLAPGAQERIREAMPRWPLNAPDFGELETLVEVEEEAAILPEAPPASSAGPEEFTSPGDGDGVVGPSGPALPQAEKPLEDWPIDWLKAELDALGIDADRRSRQSMIDAIANWRIANDPDLFGTEPF